MNTHSKYKFGEKGELLAVDHLLDKGYEILERNYRFQKAEVDILARMKNTLAVIEVKARSSTSFGEPQDFVKPKQIKNLVKAVDQYIMENDLDVEVRFDIIAIIKTAEGSRLEHLKDAFYHF
ncbi:MAG: DUF91 domain-containing protein [Flavobacteriaceae bacterium]|nr:DUF91 domain-containing protein [Flavobacteriaceae bacterium]